ncbi:hypothetical protein [Candidatus Rhabdochlamydia porcellionis]|uniref:Uncharacterized protein n=1 Tax=Candidatus Rhabdochlamydia porcellionis TaxID=225148 RepID=A0ABX8YYI6_9BACT|nr:hypothetical protein [Candidatus Rhabdochlamydia porcellionis]QZA58374.1 hypothetical protein RHAB15C_0000247 [Candidatus Rhabdochlamydia porcellionis]
MADQDFPTKDLSNAERISPTARIGEDNKTLPAGQPFSSLMKTGESPLANTRKAPMISPFDLMQSGHSPITQAATTDNLLTQVKHAHSTLGDISNQLNTPKLKLRSSDKYLLKNKLNNTTANLRAVNAKLGTNEEKQEEALPAKFQGPLGRFMNLLADGQQQLVSAQKQLQSLKSKGSSLAPADFLLIQVKLNKAQQELDFTSVLLSNAVSGFKTLMQVQL